MDQGQHQQLLKLLLYAYPDRVTVRRANDPSRGVMVGGRGVVLEPASVVRKSPLFLSIELRDVEGSNESRVSLASAIEEAWLEEVYPRLTEKKKLHRFDEARGKVVTVQQVIFAGLVVREEITGEQSDKSGLADALYEHLSRDATGFFASDEDAVKTMARLRFLRKWIPELELPEFGEDELKAVLREACEGCTREEQVRARGLGKMIEHELTWKQKGALNEHAPETLAVPSGSKIKVQYPQNGDGPPALAVRLQELFGLAETPKLAAGRAPVKIELLGPNYRPVQVTSDLKSFWNTTYAEVRRDLKIKYPKHPWPEDPWNAPAVAVGRRKK
jgi:ATP-dependent helicase HrpB